MAFIEVIARVNNHNLLDQQILFNGKILIFVWNDLFGWKPLNLFDITTFYVVIMSVLCYSRYAFFVDTWIACRNVENGKILTGYLRT